MSNPRQSFRRLLQFTVVLALCVIILGAYTRLSDAGLGCPDWPGCYGHLVGVPDELPHDRSLTRNCALAPGSYHLSLAQHIT